MQVLQAAAHVATASLRRLTDGLYIDTDDSPLLSMSPGTASTSTTTSTTDLASELTGLQVSVLTDITASAQY